MDVGRPEFPTGEDGECLVGGGEDVQARDDGGGVDESVLEVRVAREELRLQEPRVGDVLEEGDVHAVRRGDVLERDRLEERHGDVGDGKATWLGDGGGGWLCRDGSAKKRDGGAVTRNSSQLPRHGSHLPPPASLKVGT